MVKEAFVGELSFIHSIVSYKNVTQAVTESLRNQGIFSSCRSSGEQETPVWTAGKSVFPPTYQSYSGPRNISMSQKHHQ